MLSHCGKKTLVSSGYFTGCEQKRNRYMVDKSDLVFAVWNGEEKGGRKPSCDIQQFAENAKDFLLKHAFIN